MRFVGVPVADGLSFVSPTRGLTWRSTGRGGTGFHLRRTAVAPRRL